MKKKGRLNKYITTAISFFLLICFAVIVPPESSISFIVFYSLLFFALWRSLLLIGSPTRSVFRAGIILAYLLLRQYHIDNILNTILLLGIVLTLEIYFRNG